MDKFSELKAAAMAATPGPWAYESHGDTGQYGVGVLLNENDEPQNGKREQGEMLVVEVVAAEVNGSHNAAFIAAANPAVVLELLAERDADKKRIAELETIRADASQVFKEIGNELGCNPDNESIMMAIDAVKEREKRVVALAGGNAELWETMAARLEAAEAKLATPVRLPKTNGYWDEQEKAFEDAITLAKRAIWRAGFKVEGG